MGTQNPADAAHDAAIRHPQTKVTMTVNPRKSNACGHRQMQVRRVAHLG
jgi:hypothetical protein